MQPIARAGIVRAVHRRTAAGGAADRRPCGKRRRRRDDPLRLQHPDTKRPARRQHLDHGGHAGRRRAPAAPDVHALRDPRAAAQQSVAAPRWTRSTSRRVIGLISAASRGRGLPTPCLRARHAEARPRPYSARTRIASARSRRPPVALPAARAGTRRARTAGTLGAGFDALRGSRRRADLLRPQRPRPSAPTTSALIRRRAS
ncbi:MAG: hypothetical protein MZW92_50645 [Comamonadaceae bacterium]|nr:hypothetical protein [Comamonadaceae bacterium]